MSHTLLEGQRVRYIHPAAPSLFGKVGTVRTIQFARWRDHKTKRHMMATHNPDVEFDHHKGHYYSCPTDHLETLAATEEK